MEDEEINRAESFEAIFTGCVFKFIDGQREGILKQVKEENLRRRKEGEKEMTLEPNRFFNGDCHHIPNVYHGALMPYAMEWMKEHLAGKVLKTLDKTINTADPYTLEMLPGSSHRATHPSESLFGKSENEADRIWRAMRINGFMLAQEKEGWARTTTGIGQGDYARIFGQIISAGLAVAGAEGDESPLVLKLRTAPHYLPERMTGGTLVVRGDVGDFALKHSRGGTLVVDGNAGHAFGDCADNVKAYVRGDVEAITHQATNSEFYIGGKIKDKKYLEDSLKGGCKVEEGVDWNKIRCSLDGHIPFNICKNT